MPNKMLIDASHPEETRVVVVRGNRIEEFDFESQDKKQLKGNIYLARVTRVEPSLQAAFVEYGGNRHGFLAFSEIHPDYYQIPVADRQALLRAEAEEEAEDEEEEERGRGNRRRRRGGKTRDRGDDALKSAEGTEAAEAFAGPTEDQPAESGGTADETSGPVDEASETAAAAGDEAGDEDESKPSNGPSSIAAEVEVDEVSETIPEPVADDDHGGLVEEIRPARHDDDHDHEHEVESVGAEDALEEVRNRRKPP
ncbi:MAG TPA: ribonuclease E/G, partial [Rhizobiaceae bacterium]